MIRVEFSSCRFHVTNDSVLSLQVRTFSQIMWMLHPHKKPLFPGVVSRLTSQQSCGRQVCLTGAHTTSRSSFGRPHGKGGAHRQPVVPLLPTVRGGDAHCQPVDPTVPGASPHHQPVVPTVLRASAHRQPVVPPVAHSQGGQSAPPASRPHSPWRQRAPPVCRFAPACERGGRRAPPDGRLAAAHCPW
jgi:hypothetical protein